MDDKRICDYFVIAGIPNDSRSGLEGCSENDIGLSSSLKPITDITVIIPSLNESTPNEYNRIEFSQSGLTADLNHGSLKSSIFLCYRRGLDKPPLVDIGVLFEGKEALRPDYEVVRTTFYGNPANVNNGTTDKTFLTFTRAKENYPCNQLVVIDICVVFLNKGEIPPHTFCIIKKDLNRGMFGSNVFICYKKSINRPPLLRYNPSILGRFPLQDYPCYSLPQNVPMFCMPTGATIECWPMNSQHPRPTFSTFVLTSDTAVKVYGAAIAFYEHFNPDLLNDEEKNLLNYNGDKSLNAVKSICILSRWPFFDVFEKFLRFLCYLSGSLGQSISRIPIERYISHFMLDIPFPSNARPKILVQLEKDVNALISQPPEDMPLPLSGASYCKFLSNLGPKTSILVFLSVLAEKKILLYSLRPDVLTSVAEALTSLIFPFHWQCPYIPLCPLKLCGFLNAPLPFIAGVDSRYFDIYDPPADVTCVDLDTEAMFLPEHHKPILTLKVLPKKPTRMLKSALERLYDKYTKLTNAMINRNQNKRISSSTFSREMLAYKNLERQIELEIQEVFVRFMAFILKDFRSYLKPITSAPSVGSTDTNSLFDFDNFLKSRDKTCQRFYQILMKTQMFTRFIEQRSFASDKETSLAFFDECLDKIESGDFDAAHTLRLLEEESVSDRTVFIPAPEPTNEIYTYTQFGPLKESLFHRRPNNVVNNVQNNNLGSPMSRRTKHEIRSALRVARKHAETPLTWAKCLVSYCYSLWFIHLPAYIASDPVKGKQLRQAFEFLLRMQSLSLHPPDEVCYRILMLLCGVYSQPTLAVKVLCQMKRNGVIPNAITYGYYNKAVLESTWPSEKSAAAHMWSKLRNVVIGVSELKGHLKNSKKKYNSINEEENQKNVIDVGYSSSIPNDEEILIKRKDSAKNLKLKSIFRNSSSSLPCIEDYNAAAGVLMISQHYDESVFLSSNMKMEDRKVSLKRPIYTRSISFCNDFKTSKFQEGFKALKMELGKNLIESNKDTTLPSCSEDDGVSQVYESDNSQRLKNGLVDVKEIANRGLRKEEVKNLSDNIYDRFSTETKETDDQSASYEWKVEFIKPSELNYKEDLLKEGEECSSDNSDFSHREAVAALHKEDSDEILASRCSSYNENDTQQNTTCNGNAFSPFKDALLNINVFSPDNKIGSTLRSSLRFANRIASSPKSLSKSTTFHSGISSIVTREKLSNKISSIFRTNEEEKKNITRSSTLPITTELDGDSRKEDNSLWASRMSLNMEYVNSLKLAMANRISGIKNTLASSTNNSPSKISSAASTTAILNWASSKINYNSHYDKDEVGVDGKRASITSEDDIVIETHHSLFDTVESHYKSCSSVPSKIALSIKMSNCTRCSKCNVILYDEHIMENWSYQQSNLNTSCTMCATKFVPSLYISYKFLPVDCKLAKSVENFNNIENNQKKEYNISDDNFEYHCSTQHFTFPYLSPIVLRKEFESVLEHEGDACVLKGDFVDHHPIIYWNLVWYFKRINLPSHIFGLCFKSRSILRNQELIEKYEQMDYRNVDIECIWDRSDLHNKHEKPLYLQLIESTKPHSPLLDALVVDEKRVNNNLIRSIIKNINCNNMLAAMQLMINERRKQGNKKFFSMYRDLLFLSIYTAGKDNIDQAMFEREYRGAYESLISINNPQLQTTDGPPSFKAVYCRRIFKQLSLKQTEKCPN